MDKITQMFLDGELTVITGEEFARPLMEWCSEHDLKWRRNADPIANFKAELASALASLSKPANLAFHAANNQLIFCDATDAVRHGETVVSYAVCEDSFKLSARERFLSGKVAVRTGIRYVRRVFELCAAYGIPHSEDGSGVDGILVALEEVSSPFNFGLIITNGLLYWVDCNELDYTPVIEPADLFEDLA